MTIHSLFAHARTGCVLVLLLLLAMPHAVADPPPSNEKDVKALQGTWRAVTTEKEGKKIDDPIVKEITFQFADDKIIVTKLLDTADFKQMTFRIDASKKPKTIDFIAKYGTGATERVLHWYGIYELNEDSLKLCWKNLTENPNKVRPAGFETKAGDDTALLVFVREKPKKDQ